MSRQLSTTLLNNTTQPAGQSSKNISEGANDHEIPARTFSSYREGHHREGQKAKNINWKFEDAGLKCRFYQRLDSMLGAAPSGLLRVNRGADANKLDDLLTFMSNAILKSGKDIFGMQKLSKFNVPGWNERAMEFNA